MPEYTLINRLYVFVVAITFATSSVRAVEAEDNHPDGFRPAHNDRAFYDAANRRIPITINRDVELGRISPLLFGVNLSYFNDTDQLWRDHDIPAVLRRAGVSALRYPGGEETSFFHWRQPGVNGYEDAWDDPAIHGSAPQRGPFQATWVAPADWTENDAFMNFDEYIAHCRAVGAEPIVGLNLSAGRKHDRRDDALAEALAWMRHARDAGYNVKYWFLDNEPWHFEAAYQFDIRKEYAEDVVFFGEAIKAEFPQAKLIVNPVPWQHARYGDFIADFVRRTGHVIDYIDLHYYWAWGLSSWTLWMEQTPMQTTDRWSLDKPPLSVAQELRLVREACANAGYPGIGIMVLEWNLGPHADLLPLSDEAWALMQSQILMEFVDARVEAACLWPLIWRTRREVWPEQDVFPSLVEPRAPFEVTATSRLFELLKPLQGARRLSATTTSQNAVVLAAQTADGAVELIVLNKSDRRRRLDITGISADWNPSVKGQITVTAQPGPPTALRGPEGLVEVIVEPFSLTRVAWNP